MRLIGNGNAKSTKMTAIINSSRVPSKYQVNSVVAENRGNIDAYYVRDMY